MTKTNSAAAESEFTQGGFVQMIRYVLVSSLMLIAHFGLTAQTLGTESGGFYYPEKLETWDVKSEFDILFARVPYDVVEEAQTYRWPLFSLRGLMGLPENFALEGTFSTDIVMFNATIGPKWRYDFTEKFHAYLGWDVSWFGGRVNQEQFDQSAYGWLTYPNLSMGYQFGRVLVTLKGELNYLIQLSGRTGQIETSYLSSAFNGFTIAAFVEQPLWKDQYVIIGLRGNTIKFYYPTWILAPTFDKYYFVPEAVLGIRL